MARVLHQARRIGRFAPDLAEDVSPGVHTAPAEDEAMRRLMISFAMLAAALLLITPALASAEALPATATGEDADAVSDLTERIHPLDDAVLDAPSLEGEPEAIAGRRVTRVRRVRTSPSHHHHHHHGHRTVVVTRAAADPEPRVLALGPRESKVSAGLRFTAVSLGDTGLGNETFHGATLGGIGGYIRARFLSHLGMEFSADVMGNFDGEYDQLTIPVLVGVTGHLFPESTLDVYGIIGGGVLINSIDYQGSEVSGGGTTRRTFSESFLQLAGHVGGGIEIDIGALELTTDLRYMLLQARPERSAELQAAVPMEGGGSSDSVTHGLQFMLGIGGNF